MNNIQIAHETLKIIKEGKYQLHGREIVLPDVDWREVIVITPEMGRKMIEEGLPEMKKIDSEDSIPKMLEKCRMCRIAVINADSFEAGRRYENPLVMNFANAHGAGGGFLWGANAQEEALCRASTLYASITSKKAAEMYLYNNTHPSRVESDYMLISPNVVVFRGAGCLLQEKPVVMGVVTAPAPNRYGAALLAHDKMIEETFVRRIRIILLAAIRYGYRNLVLGAWGCGAFGNKPEDVAGYFKKVIVEEGYGRFFDEICFAVYGKEDGKNITAFRKVFTPPVPHDDRPQ